MTSVCRRCEIRDSDPEEFQILSVHNFDYEDHRISIRFDVERAEALTAARRPERISPQRLRYFQRRDAWIIEPDHLPHVDMKKAIIFGTGLEGVPGIRTILIEGYHRGTRAAEEGRGLAAVYLTPKETALIIVSRRTRKLKPK